MTTFKKGPESTECYIRHTIMDGQVRSYARHWDDCEAEGPYEVSASRNKVMVHHAGLKDEVDFEEFTACLKQAKKDMQMLRACNGRPRD